MKEILKFEDIHFIRKARPILDGVNWTINEGEQWALLGLNGSGKSTLLGMIPAYTYPSKGKVTVLGHTYGTVHWDKVRKNLGYVSSSLNRFRHIFNKQTALDVIKTGKDNTYGFYNDFQAPDLARLEDLVEVFGLSKVADKDFISLSQGEQRRTLLARAFMTNPSLMVLDEPCTGLDLKGREDLLSRLEDYCTKESKPLIYVTHSIEEIFPSISHVAIMEEGRINIKGPKAEVLTSEILARIYGLDIEVEEKYGRYWVKIK